MNGSVEVKSKFGEGSCFTISIPVKLEQHNLSSESTHEKIREKNQLSAIFISNKLSRTESIQELLSMSGVFTTQAFDLKNAKSMLKNN